MPPPTRPLTLPSLAELRGLLAAELARIGAPARRARLEGYLVEPSTRSLAWDYGDEDECIACWIIGCSPDGTIALAYCNNGFGPAFPWGAVIVKEAGMGHDAQWHSGLEGAAICLGLLDAPPGYEVPGPREAGG
jgi:hypothetical protein